MNKDPNDKEFRLLGVDELTIRRLRNSSIDERCERIEFEIRDLMRPSNGK